jgi:hypothetical protein
MSKFMSRFVAGMTGVLVTCAMTNPVWAGGEVPRGKGERRSVRQTEVVVRQVPCNVGCQVVTPRHPTCNDLAPEPGRRYVSVFSGLRFPQIFGFAPVARFEGGKALDIGYDEVGSGVTYRGYETDNQIDFEPEITGQYDKMYLLDRNTGALYADPVYLAARRAQSHWNRNRR